MNTAINEKTRLLFGLDFDLSSIWSVIVAYTLINTCIEPPLECPNTNITFWLYTREHLDNPHELLVNDPNTITSAPFVKNSPIKLLIHGYNGHKNFLPASELKPEYLKCCDYNIIAVDYGPIARFPCYIQAAHNTKLVGMCIAQLVDKLVQNYGFNLSLIHPIGFSLGAQAAGFLGSSIKSGRFNRITGLDPAFPLFWTSKNNEQLDAGDAEFVDILHTNSLMSGKFQSKGTIDFFANDGMMQPGCPSVSQKKSICSHHRAVAYFAESINSDVGFLATRCTSWVEYMTGLCGLVSDIREEVFFGERVPLDARGLYFFATNSESPFSIGKCSLYRLEDKLKITKDSKFKRKRKNNRKKKSYSKSKILRPL